MSDGGSQFQYDATLKQVFKAAADTVLSQIAGQNFHIVNWIETELRKVEFRQVDLLGETADGRLIQIELQTTNDPSMPLRMAEYAVGIRRQFERLPKQIVLYFGYERMRMEAELSGPDAERPDFLCRYALVDFRDVEAGPLLASQRADENVLAILGRLQDRASAVREIVERIGATDEAQRDPLIQRLMILSGLRDLDTLVNEELQRMRLIDEFADHKILGPPLRESWEQGVREGKQEGELNGQRRMAVRSFTQRFGALDADIMAKLSRLSISELDSLFTAFLDGATLDELFPKTN